MGFEVMYEEGGDFLHEPDEWLPATLAGIEPDEGQYGPSAKWIFHLDEDTQNGEVRETWAWSGQKFTPNTKMGRWITAIDPSITVGSKINLDRLVGQRVDVMFEQTTKDDGSKGEKVVKVRKSKTPAPDPAADEEPFEAVSAVTGQAAASADDLFD